MSRLALVLGGIELVAHSGPIRQRYEPLVGGALLRLSQGTGVIMTHWRKSRITASGSGHLDPGLEDLNYGMPLELWCVKARSKDSTGREFILPAGSGGPRPDYAPWGLAQVGETWVETALHQVGHSVELHAVPGADSYRLCWMPMFVVHTKGVVSDFDQQSGLYDWSLEAEEL